MADSGDLLRMLEPTVRPVAAPGVRPARSSSAPFESTSFESLLHEAQAHDATNENEDSTEIAKTANMLSPLSNIDAIQNASLRQIIESSLPGGSEQEERNQ